ncbi:MAG: PIN domain-containing protein [Candidatus Dormiibacterota bacterium]
MALICDTGPLVAAADRSDPHHERCAALIADTQERLVVPFCVLVEVEYHLRPWAGAFENLLADFDRGALELLDVPTRWLLRAGQLLSRYRDLKLGLVDATVLAATEMLGEPKVATLDHRHFSVVRPAHVEALTLLP